MKGCYTYKVLQGEGVLAECATLEIAFLMVKALFDDTTRDLLREVRILRESKETCKGEE